MSDLTAHDFMDHLITAIKRGDAIRTTIKRTISSNTGPFRDLLEDWFKEFESSKNLKKIYDRIYYPENINLLTLLEYGMDGHPILQSLEKLQEETALIIQARLESQLQSLPYKMLVPLFVFFFPALAWSFLGPFLKELKNGF